MWLIALAIIIIALALIIIALAIIRQAYITVQVTVDRAV